MLEHLKIVNYRLFKDLEINQLGQINLIAGKNNAGKTAFLEAIALSQSNINFCNRLLSAFIKLRGEFFLSSENVIDLFCDIKFYNEEGYTVVAGNFKIHYNKNSHRFYLNIEGKSEELNITEERDSERIDQYFSELKNTVIFLPFKTGFNISHLWENIDLTPKKKDVIKILQTIDSKIIDIGIDLRNRQPKVLLEGSTTPTPLDRFGDGVNRLFRIALCLVNAKNKTLLIDELEAGLHYSVQEELWDIIFHYAKAWNIQVFVATHSRDTIKSFYYVANKSEYEGMGRYFSLAREKDNTIAVDYDMEEIDLALSSNIEIR